MSAGWPAICVSVDYEISVYLSRESRSPHDNLIVAWLQQPQQIQTSSSAAYSFLTTKILLSCIPLILLKGYRQSSTSFSGICFAHLNDLESKKLPTFTPSCIIYLAYLWDDCSWEIAVLRNYVKQYIFCSFHIILSRNVKVRLQWTVNILIYLVSLLPSAA